MPGRSRTHPDHSYLNDLCCCSEGQIIATTLTGTVRSCGVMNRGLLGTRPSTCVTGSVRVTETVSTLMPSLKPASAPRRGL